MEGINLKDRQFGIDLSHLSTEISEGDDEPLTTFRQLSPKLNCSSVVGRLAKFFSDADQIESLWIAQCIAAINHYKYNPSHEGAMEIVDTYLTVDTELERGHVCFRGLYGLADEGEFVQQMISIQQALEPHGKPSEQLFEELFEYLIHVLDARHDLSKSPEMSELLTLTDAPVEQKGGGRRRLPARLKRTSSRLLLQPTVDLESEIASLVKRFARIPEKIEEHGGSWSEQKAVQIARLLLQKTQKGRAAIAVIDHALGRSPDIQDFYALRHRLTTGELVEGTVDKQIEVMVMGEGDPSKWLAELKKRVKPVVDLRLREAIFWSLHVDESIPPLEVETLERELEVKKSEFLQSKRALRQLVELHLPLHWTSLFSRQSEGWEVQPLPLLRNTLGYAVKHSQTTVAEIQLKIQFDQDEDNLPTKVKIRPQSWLLPKPKDDLWYLYL